MGITLNRVGRDILARGGHDDASDDDLLLMELMRQAPGMKREDYEACFVALRIEYGDDALRAITSGHVQFELRAKVAG